MNLLPQEQVSLEHKMLKCNYHTTLDPQCKHNINANVFLTIKMNKGQSLRRWQCICGADVGQSSKAEAERLNIKPMPFNVERFKEHEQRTTKAFNDAKEERMRNYTALKEERSKSHAEYCRTPEWKEVRNRVLKRDNYLCQGCLINRATLVHHKSYDFVRRELCDLLISYCNDCHKKVHGLEEKVS